MDDIDHLELTPSLLAFYRSKINELQKDQTTGFLDRLKHIEMSAQERNSLERELLEYEDDLDQKQQDIDHLCTALVRERRAVIQLVQENAQLQESSGDYEDPLMETDRLSSLRRQYETLLTSILSDHKSYLAQIRGQRDSTTSKMEDLLSRCEKLELALAEGTKELIKERGEKQVLQIRVEEMQTNIEQRIQGLRKRLDDSGHGSVDQTPELNRLKVENQHLRATVDEFKDRLAAQSSAAQDRIARLELELHRRKQLDYELELHANPNFQDRIKQIERLALRYAPLQGPEVDFLFSEIDYAKDVLSGTIPPPHPKRTKSNRKNKIPHI